MSKKLITFKNAADTIVRYEKKHKNALEYLVGIPAKTDKGIQGLHLGVGCNLFEQKVTPIPQGFHKVRGNAAYFREFYLEKPRLPPRDGSLPLEKWIDSTRRWWMRISDVQKLKPGDKLKLIALDRNVGDSTMDEQVNRESHSYSARHFFRPQIVEYEHVGPGAFGRFLWPWMTPEDYVNEKPQEWHINYLKYNWSPLINQELTTTDKKTKPRSLHYSKFPSDTPLGWRGPMINVKHAKDLPRVYWRRHCPSI